MCDNPEHQHQDENLLDVIKNEIHEPKEVAEVAIQIFCALASSLAQAEIPNPAIWAAFEPMKLLAEKLADQELIDIVITSEMEHSEAIEKLVSKAIHPANKGRNKKRKGND
jgi:hypothetical protein